MADQNFNRNLNAKKAQDDYLNADEYARKTLAEKGILPPRYVADGKYKELTKPIQLTEGELLEIDDFLHCIEYGNVRTFVDFDRLGWRENMNEDDLNKFTDFRNHVRNNIEMINDARRLLLKKILKENQYPKCDASKFNDYYEQEYSNNEILDPTWGMKINYYVPEVQISFSHSNETMEQTLQ